MDSDAVGAIQGDADATSRTHVSKPQIVSLFSKTENCEGCNRTIKSLWFTKGGWWFCSECHRRLKDVEELAAA